MSNELFYCCHEKQDGAVIPVFLSIYSISTYFQGHATRLSLSWLSGTRVQNENFYHCYIQTKLWAEWCVNQMWKSSKTDHLNEDEYSISLINKKECRQWFNISTQISTPESEREAVHEGQRSSPCTNIIVTLQERRTRASTGMNSNQLQSFKFGIQMLGFISVNPSWRHLL